MICPNCGAIAGIMNLDEMFRNHSVHGHPSHDANHSDGASMLAVGAAVVLATLTYMFSDSHHQHHCSKCGHNW